jgi:hypothetical protein
MANNKRKQAKKKAAAAKNAPYKPPLGLQIGFGLGMAVLQAVFGAITIYESPGESPAKELPPPADELTLNPETGHYEPKK